MRHTKPVEVLLVEDNSGDILVVKHAIARERFPVSIRVAVDGEQAIDLLGRHHFDQDLVILDLKLPKVDGLTVLERAHPNVPVVVFSSSASSAEIQRSFELGVKDFIPKPTDLDDYSRVVCFMVRKWGAEAGLVEAPEARF
jgi:two-component system response regulator